ncbi:unnamed protein product [Closterium sp. NIES-54]
MAQADYPCFSEALRLWKNRTALEQSQVQLPALSPSWSAAEEDPRIEASWDSSEAAEESSEAAVSSFEAEEISYEAAGYSSETSEEFSGAADDFPVPAEASIEAPVEPSDRESRMECDGVSVCSIVASMISMVDSSCKTLLSSSFGNTTRLYSSGDYVDYSKSFSFAVPWAAVTREAVSAGHGKPKKGNNGDLKQEPNQVLKSAATTELASSKCMVSRMTLASLKLLPTRIPKPVSARAPALKAVAAEQRKVLLESVCSRIPKPRSARASAVKTVAVEERKPYPPCALGSQQRNHHLPVACIGMVGGSEGRGYNTFFQGF